MYFTTGVLFLNTFNKPFIIIIITFKSVFNNFSEIVVLCSLFFIILFYFFIVIAIILTLHRK